jgi:hypothetical protein
MSKATALLHALPASTCVEVTLGFVGGNLLAIEHIDEGADHAFPNLPQFVRGEAGESVVLVPAGAILSLQRPQQCLSADALRATGSLVPSATHPAAEELRLPAEGQVCIVLQGLSITLRRVTREAPPPRPELDVRSHRWTLASAAVYSIMLGSLFFAPPTGHGMVSLDDLGQDHLRLVKTALLAAVPEPETPPPDASANASGGQEGQRAEGAEGKAGKPGAASTNRRYGVADRGPDKALPREQLVDAAKNGGILGTIAALSGSVSAPSSPYGSASPSGYDALDAMGALFGAQVGENEGYGGLGLRGSGRSGGGDGLGTIGVGKLGTLGGGGTGGTGPGYGHGVGGLGGRNAKVPRLIMHEAEVRGSLSKEVIRRTIQRHTNQVRFCYEQGLSQRPDLAGRVDMQFVIAPSGAVQAAEVASSTLQEARTENCIRDAVRRFAFPAPDGGGVVIVRYPFVFQTTQP